MIAAQDTPTPHPLQSTEYLKPHKTPCELPHKYQYPVTLKNSDFSHRVTASNKTT